MPITLDPNLDPELYPLAWLIGDWSGEGAATVPVTGRDDEASDADDADAPSGAQSAADSGEPDSSGGAAGEAETEGRRIEQTVSVEPTENGAVRWSMRTWILDAPPPVPPTAVFANSAEDDAKRDAAEESDSEDKADPERRLLIEETQYWRVTGPLPGQDLEAAQKAKPGSPDSLVSYGLEVVSASSEGAMVLYSGEVRGPRIRLASEGIGRTSQSEAFDSSSRMFGLVGGRLMWVLDRGSDGQEAQTFLSAELDRQ